MALLDRSYHVPVRLPQAEKMFVGDWDESFPRLPILFLLWIME